MVTIKRLQEHEIYDNLPKLRQLIRAACNPPQTATSDDYTRILISSIVSPAVLPLGIRYNGILSGLLLAAIGQAYDRPESVCHIMLISLEKPVSFKEIYQDLRQQVMDWCRQHNVNTILTSSPRRGFMRLLAQIDKWTVTPVYQLKVEG